MSGNAGSEPPAFALGLTGKCAEVLERQECNVTGTVPSWLSGCTLLRNGALRVGCPALNTPHHDVPAARNQRCSKLACMVGHDELWEGSDVVCALSRHWQASSVLPNHAGPGTFDIELAGGRGTLTVPHW